MIQHVEKAPPDILPDQVQQFVTQLTIDKKAEAAYKMSETFRQEAAQLTRRGDKAEEEDGQREGLQAALQLGSLDILQYTETYGTRTNWRPSLCDRKAQRRYASWGGQATNVKSSCVTPIETCGTRRRTRRISQRQSTKGSRWATRGRRARRTLTAVVSPIFSPTTDATASFRCKK